MHLHKMALFSLGELVSDVATPRHTRACAHVKFTGSQAKIMWKAKLKAVISMHDRFHVDVKQAYK